MPDRTTMKTARALVPLVPVAPRLAEERLRERIYDLAKELGLDEYRIVEPMPRGKLSGAGAPLSRNQHEA